MKGCDGIMNTSLKRHEFDQNLLKAWKNNPLRIIGTLSKCHQKPTFIAQSLSGGLVKAFCSQCKSEGYFSFEEFKALRLWVACPTCNKLMSAGMVEPKDKNYVFICKDCGVYIRLADILPNH